MIARIILRSLEHRALVLALSLLLAAAGTWSLFHTPVDAIPDLPDVQVIIRTTWPGQAPQVVEDQVTFPLGSAMLAVPGATTVRGYSAFGDSFVHVIFEEGTDLYWARSRVLEYLSQVMPRLPPAARPALGPDATGVGWVYSYALVDRSGRHDLGELRALQDWFLKLALQSVPGVAEVASVGGMVRQFQVELDPERLAAYGFSLADARRAIARGNQEAGGSVIEMGEAQYMLRATGYVQSLEDLRRIPLDATDRGTAVLIGDVADVRMGPEARAGIAELDGEGEVTGGIVVMRHGENALATIAAVKRQIEELRRSLPPGVEIVETYDRSGLIQRAIDALTWKLIVEFLIVSLVCVVFLAHLRSALVVVISLPLGILAAFLIMRAQGINADIMSLGGIAIAIGAMVDAAIVMIENVHKHLERAPGAERLEVMRRACTEVGPALFFSLVIITLSFLPVFALQAEEGRLFKPLAYTKSYAMAAAAGLAVTLVPVLITALVRGPVPAEAHNPVNRLLMAAYRPLILASLRMPRRVVFAAIVVTALGLWPLSQLGTEFMPEMDEGDLMYMPTLMPAVSVGKAAQVLQQTDKAIRAVPEVQQVFGKIGRAETATDPAPLSMIETIVRLKPRSEWRPGMTPERLREELDQAVRLPGITNAWVMPIRTRIDMLATGIKTPVGLKISGPDLETIDRIGREVESVLRNLPESGSVYYERLSGGRYIVVDIDRLAAARLAFNVADIQDVIATAVGGINIGETVIGRERYPINLRYPRELRDSIDALQRLPLIAMSGDSLALGDVADVRIESGPEMMRSENARLSGWIYVDPGTRDLQGYVERARRAVADAVSLPPGYTLSWSGQYEALERAAERLRLIVPLTLAVIVLLLYLQFRRLGPALIVLGSLPFALVGGVWLVYLLGYHLSVAIAIGFIALAGIAAETGIVMLVFLEQAYERHAARAAAKGRPLGSEGIREAIIEGAVLRLRPKVMTVTAIIAGLLPVLLAGGTGAEVMRPVAAPMVGGMISAAVLTLVIIPAVYLLWRDREPPSGASVRST